MLYAMFTVVLCLFSGGGGGGGVPSLWWVGGGGPSYVFGVSPDNLLVWGYFAN